MADIDFIVTSEIQEWLDSKNWSKILTFEELSKESPEEYKALLDLCKYVTKAPSFQVLLKAITELEKTAATLQSTNYNEVSYHRASINGIRMLENLMLTLSNVSPDRAIEDKVQDKYSIIE